MRIGPLISSNSNADGLVYHVMIFNAKFTFIIGNGQHFSGWFKSASGNKQQLHCRKYNTDLQYLAPVQKGTL